MIQMDSTIHWTADLQMRRSAKRSYEHKIRYRHRSVDPRIRESIHIFMCIHTYTYNRSIALNWDVYAMPRACSSAKILHGVPKHYKTSLSAVNCKVVLTISSISILLVYVCVLIEFYSYIYSSDHTYASQWSIYKIHKAAFTIIKKCRW